MHPSKSISLNTDRTKLPLLSFLQVEKMKCFGGYELAPTCRDGSKETDSQVQRRFPVRFRQGVGVEYASRESEGGPAGEEGRRG